MDTLVREKEVLLQELNHRVANSLQIIASVLMQRVRSVQSEEARGHLQDAHHRVMSVATLQRQLAKSASGDVALRPYLTDLCASIAASMISDPDMVRLTVDADNSVMPADQSVSIGLIVTELVINSLKHAFPNTNRKGEIRVAFETSDNGWALTVADDGIGIIGDHASVKQGLGTGIVNALATQLAATVEVTDAKPGCVVLVSTADHIASGWGLTG
jgi:two-component sensor histidine kinase